MLILMYIGVGTRHGHESSPDLIAIHTVLVKEKAEPSNLMLLKEVCLLIKT